MRVLVICYEYPPLGGGGAPVCEAICESLAERGHHIDVVTTAQGDLPLHEVRRHVRLHRVRARRRHRHMTSSAEMATALVPSYRLATRLARRHDYDVIHCHFIFPSGGVAERVARSTGLPLIITSHGSDVPGYNPDRFGWEHRLLQPLWRRVVRRAAAVTTSSRYLAGLIEAQAGVGEVTLIPQGFTPQPTPPTPRRDRILCACRMFKRKGVQDLIEAMRGADPHWELVIAGDGPYLPDAKKLAAEAGVPALFLGMVDRGELRSLYASSRVFVLPSWSENYPVVLQEAMAGGCAVVTTSGTGCAEVVGDAALLVEPAQPEQLRAALRKLMADPQEVNRLGVLSRQRLTRFAWPRIAGEYAALYERVAAAHAARHATPARGLHA